jgi:excinuclease ABC subunit B
VILYADKMTASMKTAIDETLRRRELQEKYNIENKITPQTIKKAISDVMHSIYERDYAGVPDADEEAISPGSLKKRIDKLRRQMFSAAKKLDFETAAELRDRILDLEKRELGL